MTESAIIDWHAVDRPLPGHRRPGHGTPIVLLHGFTQTGLSWEPVATRLRHDVDLLAPDAPGHGRSAESSLAIDEYAASLASSVGPALYVGYSMGGRTALHVATSRPDLVRGLVLIGATPGLESESERHDRRTADEALARRIVDIGLDPFLEEWLAQPLFRSLARDSWNLVDRRRNTPRGLASSLRTAGTGTQESLWNRLVDVACPTVLVTGSLDEKFTALARRMSASISDSEHVVVADRGHAVHLEDPRTVADIVNRLSSLVA